MVSILASQVFNFARQTMNKIIIQTPPGTKARWVHEAQKIGMKLSDWVQLQVNKGMSK